MLLPKNFMKSSYLLTKHLKMTWAKYLEVKMITFQILKHKSPKRATNFGLTQKIIVMIQIRDMCEK